MKAEEFSEALNDIDKKYIDEALEYNKMKKSLRVWQIAAACACVLLAGSVAFTVAKMNSATSGGYESKTVYSNSYYSNDFDEVEDLAEIVEEATYAYSAEYYYNNATASDEFAFDEVAAADGFAFDKGAVTESFAFDEAAAEFRIGEDASDEDEGSVNPAKIIYNVSMNMQTTEFDDAISGIDELTAQYGGYFESQSISNNSGNYRRAYYTIRIPSENLDAFLDGAGSISTVTYMTRNAEDVSESYYDIQSRLETARTKLERLNELLAKAEDMEDIITLEYAISDTELEIDSYSGSLRYYDSKVAYSTVDITLNEVYEVIIEEAPMTFGDKISQAAEQGVKGFGDFLKDLAIWFAESWIWLLIIVAVIVIVIAIIKIVIKKKKDK